MSSAVAPARVALLGHPCGGGLPSDPIGSFGGRTISLAVPRFFAEVSVEPSDRLEIVALEVDQPSWGCVGDLMTQIDEWGYTGPIQLLTAALRTLADLLDSVGSPAFRDYRCRLRYHSTIPAGVGLGESSALVVAALTALTESVGLDVPKPVLATVAHRVETQQLGRIAELDDAVVQACGGLVAVDFDTETVDGHFGVGYGDAAQLPGAGLPELYLAYRHEPLEVRDFDSRPEDAGTAESLFVRLRRSSEPGHGQVREVLRQLAALAIEGEAALRWRHRGRFADLLHQDLRLRRLLLPLTDIQEALIGVADDHRSPTTLATSLAGPLSGASVVGVVHDDEHRAELAAAFSALDAEFVVLQSPAELDSTEVGSSGSVATADCRDDGSDDGEDDPDTVIPFDPRPNPNPNPDPGPDGAA